MPIANPTTFNANVARRSLHFPRDATRHGLHHITIIIIVSASVGGVLITLLLWCFRSRSSRSSRSAPLPPRQALVHQREQQLAAFTEHQNVSVPRKFIDDRPSSPVRHRYGSTASLIPLVENSSPNNSSHVSLYTHETDGGNEGLSNSRGNPLHPPMPHFSAPHPPHNASSASLLSSNDHASEPTATGSTSVYPSQSLRRPNPRSRPRQLSVVSNGTSHTGTSVRSRSSIRSAPHAPHSNVQIVLPAPLAPNLYPSAAGEHERQSLIGDTAYGDNWRTSLADKWIPVGQQSHGPEPKSVRRQHSHDSMGRQAQKEASLGLIPHRRTSSNPPPSRLRHFQKPSLDNSFSDTPPVPRVPSVYATLPRQDAPVILGPSGREVLPVPPSFPNSHSTRS